MYKSIIALFFTMFFTIIIVMPSVISIMDINADIVEMIDVNDDEEKESKESTKDIEVKILQDFRGELSLLDYHIIKDLEFYSNSYTSKDLELYSPPPESI